jgi:hypothetical protein
MNLSSGVGTSKSIISQLMAKAIMTSQKMQKTSTTENFINGGIQIESMELAGNVKKKCPWFGTKLMRFTRGKK